jgi:hypothetical protein
MKTKIKFPISGPNAIAVETLPNGAKFYSVFARPNAEYLLSQVPKGPNPRDVDDTAKIPKEIFDSYLKDDLFPIKCRGMRAIIDTDSLELEEPNKPTGQWYVVISCDDFLAGHYDGQHASDRADAAIGELDEKGDKTFAFHFTERAAFQSRHQIRDVAAASNAVQPQQNKSEINILGGFDNIKSNVSYCSQNNIGWKQHQRSTTGEKVPEELSVSQVTCLLGALLPKAYVTDVGVSNISSWPKRGQETVSKYWQSKTLSPLLNSASKHVDMVLEFADFVQTSMDTILGTSKETCAILHKASKPCLKKNISERPAFSNHIFLTAKPVEHALTKEVLATVCYAMFNNVFVYNQQTHEFVPSYKIEELQAMWLACGKEVLQIIEGRFNTTFQPLFNTRWGDFVADETLWALCSDRVAKTVHTKNSWDQYLDMSVNMGAVATQNIPPVDQSKSATH